MSINNYDVGRQIGRGGFAEVYGARDRTTGFEVAIKITNKIKIIDLGVGARVDNEIQLHSKMHHQNIVQLFNSFEDDENVYMVMEICKYGNMFKYLRSFGPLTEEEAVYVTLQLLHSLEHIHTTGVVHRDLKLSNILIHDIAASKSSSSSPAGEQESYNIQRLSVKICDFGLAVRILHPDEEHFTLCGTPNYIAPEIASQRSSHGYPADMWSVGCLFYSIVIGEPPFEQESIPQTLQAIMSGEYNLPPGKFSAAGENFLRTLLNLDPARRPTVAQILRHPLFQQYDQCNKQCAAMTSPSLITADVNGSNLTTAMGSYNSVNTNHSNGTSINYPQTPPRRYQEREALQENSRGRQQAIRDLYIHDVLDQKNLPYQSEASRSLSCSGKKTNRTTLAYVPRENHNLDFIPTSRPTKPVAIRNNNLLSSSIDSINSTSSQATTAVSGGWLNEISDIRLSFGGAARYSEGYGSGGNSGNGSSRSNIISNNKLDSQRHRFRYVNDVPSEAPVIASPSVADDNSMHHMEVLNIYNDIKDSAKALPPCAIPVRSSNGILLLSSSRDVCFVTRFSAQSQNRSSASTSYKMRVLLKSSQPYRLYVGRVSSSMEEEISHAMISSTSRTTDDLSGGSPTTVQTDYPSLLDTSDCKVFWIKSAILLPSSTPVLSSPPHPSSPLPKCVCMALHHMAAVFEGIRRTTPKLILYLATSSVHELGNIRRDPLFQRSNLTNNDNVTSEVDDLHVVHREKRTSNVDCKCMLMSNSPMPDFQAQFADGTRLKYSLQQNTLLIERKQQASKLLAGDRPDSQGIRWEGVIDPAAPTGEQLNSSYDTITMGSHLNSMPAHLRLYTTVAQKALSLCMDELQLREQQQDNSLKRMKSDGSPIIIVRE